MSHSRSPDGAPDSIDDRGSAAATCYAAAASAGDTTEISAGTVLFGEYEVTELLGSGGMGRVYRAWHRSLGEPRAIKVLRPELARDATAVQLFAREARALLEIRNDAVVRCHDLLRDERDAFVLITELVEGPPLSAVLQERRLTAQELTALCDRLASGLAAIHARGVVHRDVSPDNIILESGRIERAKWIDFGIARVMDAETTTTGFKGKLRYASPEQIGHFGGKIGPRSDLYSLGLLLLEAATGRGPKIPQTLARAVEMRRQRVPIPKRLPRALRSDLTRLLEPDPARRLDSAARLRSRLRRRTLGARVRQGVVGVAASLTLLWLGTQAIDPLRSRVSLDPSAVWSNATQGLGQGMDDLAEVWRDLRAAPESASLRSPEPSAAPRSSEVRADAPSLPSSLDPAEIDPPEVGPPEAPTSRGPGPDIDPPPPGDVAPAELSEPHTPTHTPTVRTFSLPLPSSTGDALDRAAAALTPAVSPPSNAGTGSVPSVGSGPPAQADADADSSPLVPRNDPVRETPNSEPEASGERSAPVPCNPEASRARAGQLYGAGRFCEAASLLERCCPGSVRWCAEMRSEIQRKCR